MSEFERPQGNDTSDNTHQQHNNTDDYQDDNNGHGPRRARRTTTIRTTTTITTMTSNGHYPLQIMTNKRVESSPTVNNGPRSSSEPTLTADPMLSVPTNAAAASAQVIEAADITATREFQVSASVPASAVAPVAHLEGNLPSSLQLSRCHPSTLPRHDDEYDDDGYDGDGYYSPETNDNKLEQTMISNKYTSNNANNNANDANNSPLGELFLFTTIAAVSQWKLGGQMMTSEQITKEQRLVLSERGAVFT
ncbi:hypothetical protein BYT27DRAFT_7212684 [Phlegmacium glaucopus]|nr:hypothetical protein BYT27DRAFT_7212684 [Phlegmacium glaucopus]